MFFSRTLLKIFRPLPDSQEDIDKSQALGKSPGRPSVSSEEDSSPIKWKARKNFLKDVNPSTAQLTILLSTILEITSPTHLLAQENKG